MPLKWEELTQEQTKETLDLIQRKWAIEAMLGKIDKSRQEAEGIRRNQETALGSELTLINIKLGEIRQPTEVEQDEEKEVESGS